MNLSHIGTAAAAAKSLQWCPTLCDSMDCSLPGSCVHGIFQARVLEWSAIAFSDPTAYSRLIYPSIEEGPHIYPMKTREHNRILQWFLRARHSKTQELMGWVMHRRCGFHEATCHARVVFPHASS